MAKISDARRRANEKYNAKAYDEIKVRVPKGRKAEIQAAADALGESLNKFVATAIDKRLKSACPPQGEQDREENG